VAVDPELASRRRPVFISYSRMDYYFAECLAWRLEQHGVRGWLDARDLTPGVDWERDLHAALDRAECLVLVSSPEALLSASVQAELARARAGGKRIILARFRGRVPLELRNLETVDFRGSFPHALDLLVKRLSSTAAGHPGRAWSVPAVPPWVAATAICLAGVTVLPMLYPLFHGMLGAVGAETVDRGLRVFAPIALLAIVGLVIWNFFVAFLRRRMGMTRLFLCFPVVGLMVGYGLTLPPSAGLTALERWAYSIPVLVMAGLGIGIVWFKRPGDLLRWAPTGTGWARYRARQARQLVQGEHNRLGRLRQIRRFRLVHHHTDAPAAAHLGQKLCAGGATEESAGGADTTALVLITNRTPCRWIAERREALAQPFITVVGTPIRLDESLAWLWRIQWLDLRRWDLQSNLVEDRLLQVPEALAQPRFPAILWAAHHLLCATGALLFAAASAGADDFRDLTLATGFRAVTAYASILWGLLAWWLLRRSIGKPRFDRCLLGGFALTIPTSCWLLLQLAVGTGRWTGACLALAFVTLAPAFFWWNRTRLRFWFPVLAGGRSGREDRGLEPKGGWRTALWMFGFAVIWLMVLGED
jgi:hypothetical protein